MKELTKEFYLDIDKSTSVWTYYLRLRKYSEQSVGVQVATFNSYTVAQHPGLAKDIVRILNEQLGSLPTQ